MLAEVHSGPLERLIPPGLASAGDSSAGGIHPWPTTPHPHADARRRASGLDVRYAISQNIKAIGIGPACSVFFFRPSNGRGISDAPPASIDSVCSATCLTTLYVTPRPHAPSSSPPWYMARPHPMVTLPHNLGPDGLLQFPACC